MARYVTIAILTGKMPEAHLVDAFDDDKDGLLDEAVADAALDAACTDVESYLQGRYEVPFTDPIPAVVSKAALLFAMETVHNRRQVAIPETLATQIADVRKQLTAIGAGEQPLTPEIEQSGGVGEAITEDASINGTMG